MDNLNLDIDTYSLEDLSKLFHLKDEYNEIDIDNEKQTLLLQLRDIGDIGVEKKRNITFFIECAAGRLITLANDKKTDENQGTWSQLKNDTIQEGSHTIIENPNIKAGQVASFSDGRTAGSNNTPPGFLNPINVKSFARGVNIDSRFRDNYYSTHSHDYVVSLPDTYRKVTEMRIGSIELPMTMYAISKHSGNNTFVIKDTINNNAWLLTVPDGNYEISWQDQSVAQDIITTMNQAISMALPGTIDECGKFVIDLSKNPLDPTRDICYTIDRNTGRSIFANVIDKNQDNALKTGGDIIEQIIELSNNELSNNELSMNELSMIELSNNITSTKTNIKKYNDCDVTLYDTSYNDLTHADLEKVYLETRNQTKIINNILIDSSYSEANKLITIKDIVKDVGNLNNTLNIIDTQINTSDVGNIIDEANSLQEISENIIYNYKNISNKLQKLDDSTVSLNNIKYKNTEKFFDARYNYKNSKVRKTKSISDASKELEDATNRYEKLQDASLATLEIFKYFDLSDDDVSKLRHYIPGYDVSLVSIDVNKTNDIITNINNLKLEEIKLIKIINNQILEAINENNVFLMEKDIYKFIDDISVNDVSNQILYTYKEDTDNFEEEIIDGSSNFNVIFRIESLLKFLEDISINNNEISELKNLINRNYSQLLYYECALRFAYMLKIMEDNDISGGFISDPSAVLVLQNSEKRKNDLLNLIQIYEKNLSKDYSKVFDLCGNRNIDISGTSFDLLNEQFELSGNIFKTNSSNLFSLLETVLEPHGNSDDYTFDISSIRIDNSFNIQGGNFYQNISVDSNNIDISNVYIREQDWGVAKANIKKCHLIFLNYEKYNFDDPENDDRAWKFDYQGFAYQGFAYQTDMRPKTSHTQDIAVDFSEITNTFIQLIREYFTNFLRSITNEVIFNEEFIDNSTNRIIYKENDDKWYTNLSSNQWMKDEKLSDENLSDNNNLNKYNNYTKRLIKIGKDIFRFEYTPLMLKPSQIDVINYDYISNNLNNFNNLVTNSDMNTFYNKNTINETYNIELDEKSPQEYSLTGYSDIDLNTNSYFNANIKLLAEYPTKYDELQTQLDETFRQQDADVEKSGLLLLASDAYYKSIIFRDPNINTKDSSDNVMERDFEPSEIEKNYIESLAELAFAENILKELDNDYKRLTDSDGLWNYFGTSFGVYEIKKNWDKIYPLIKPMYSKPPSEKPNDHVKGIEILSNWWFGKLVLDPNDIRTPGDDDTGVVKHIIENTTQCMNKYFKVILRSGVENPGEDFSLLLNGFRDISSVEIRLFDYDKFVNEIMKKDHFNQQKKTILSSALKKFKIYQRYFNDLMTNLLKIFLYYDSEVGGYRNLWFNGIIGYNTRTSWATNDKSVKVITAASWWGENGLEHHEVINGLPRDRLEAITDVKWKAGARYRNWADYYYFNLSSPGTIFSRKEIDFIKGGYTYLFKFVRYDFERFYLKLNQVLEQEVSPGGKLREHKDYCEGLWNEENKNLIDEADKNIGFFIVQKELFKVKHLRISKYYTASLKKQEYILKKSHSLFSRYNNDTISNFDNIVYSSSELLSSSISSLAYEIYHIETKINACKLNKLTRLQTNHMYAEMATEVTGKIVQGILNYAGLSSSVPIGPTFIAPLIVADILNAIATGIEMKLRSDVGLASADVDRRMAMKELEKSRAEMELAIESKHNSKVKFLSSINDFLNNGVILKENMDDASTNLINMKSILDNNVKTYETDIEEIAKQTFCKVISENQAIELESIKNIESQFIEISDIIENNNRQIETRKKKLDNFGKTITALNYNMTESFASIIPNNWELLFNVDVNGNVDLTENLQLRLGWMLGFRAGCYKPDIVDGAAVTSEGICLVSPPRYLFISINDGQKSQGTGLVAAYSQSSLDSNIMTRINCAATMDSTKVFKCASDVGLSNQLNRTRQYFGPVNISRLHIQVLDEYGRHVSLNHMDWSLTLVFDQLYD